MIVPNPCFLLTREMLYTALTRQKNRVVVLYQGSVFDIKELSSPLKSDTLRRITNLFIKPDLLEIDDHFLEKNLIHEASDGTMLRSKSELLIYQQLLSKGLTPVYEKKLSINEVEKTPDFTIEIDETGEVFYWEHCGLMFDVNYEKRWKEKLKWYRENHILPFGESDEKQVATLIISEDHPAQVEDGSTKGAISVKEIDSIIKKVFDRG